MEARYMKRRNETTGVEEKFYPITHIDAVVGLSKELADLNGNLIKLESDLVDKVEQEDLDENVDAKLDAAKADIAQQVIDAFGGIPVFGTVNDDNTITVTSALAEGTYIIKYEMEDGTTSEIGRVTIEADLPIYTNQIPISTDTSGNVYNEVGFKTNYRLNSSGVEAEQAGMCCTGFIPANSEDVIEMKNVTVAGTKTAYIATYKADKSFKQVATIDELFTQDAYGVYRGTVPMSSEIAFIRFSLGTIDTTSIITVNEEIL